MIYALQATLRFTTGAKRDNVKAAAESQVASKPRWGTTTITAGTETVAPFTLTVDLRFTTQTDLTDAYTSLESSARAQNALGRISRHDCPHDAATPVPCVVGAEVTL